jgi:hypothetical protein
VIETHGADHQGPDREEVELCLRLRKRGLTTRRRAAARKGAGAPRRGR